MKNKKRLFLCLSLLVITIGVFSQLSGDVYFIQFSDKINTPFSTNNPSEYLSEKAIQRRVNFQVSITSSDLPVNPSYIQQVLETGTELVATTKWLNGISVIPDNIQSLDAIRELPFVESVIKTHNVAFGLKSRIDSIKFVINEKYTPLKHESLKKSTSNLDYGDAYHQIKMHNGNILHDFGYLGQGITIAVLDNGFENVDVLGVFDSIWANNQILSTFDFVRRQEIGFNIADHGTKVLSTMAANSPGRIIGTAPKADYHLIRTEINDSESLLEEFLWISGAEYADSVGADIITSSLGYSEFDDAMQNHSYSDMDGSTTPITKVADIAASKGMLVIVSAGNSGNNPWGYIAAPADGNNVLTVGGVDRLGLVAEFSSRGPTADGRIKPNVVALGESATFVNASNIIMTGNGTSFSAPIIAGLAACLWQINPLLSNLELKEIIEKSSDRWNNPDNMYGYGLPDFYLASGFNTAINENMEDILSILSVFPNPVKDNFTLIVRSPNNETAEIRILDLNGKIVFTDERQLTNRFNLFYFSDMHFLDKGIYILQILSSHLNVHLKIMK
ncbi:MAG: S8 family serine peptidase, partial [Bacteroidetes bacterium]|nr:S8 family serine peptidase [Bacteroidota bacterium]